MWQTLKNTLDPILRMGSFASFLYNKREQTTKNIKKQSIYIYIYIYIYISNV